MKSAPAFRRNVQKLLAGRIGELKNETHAFFQEGVQSIQKFFDDERQVIFIFDSLEQLRGSLFNEQEVLQSSTPVLIDFWAPWCGPCRAIAPVVQEIAQDYAGKLKVLKMNVDDNPRTPSRYGVRGIPNLIIFHGGQVKEQIVGAVPKAQLVKAIDQVVNGHA